VQYRVIGVHLTGLTVARGVGRWLSRKRISLKELKKKHLSGRNFGTELKPQY
jgi:hypothetical protein